MSSADNDTNGNGSASPNDANRDTQTSGGLSEDAKKEVNEMVSKAIGSRFKDFESKQAKSQKEFGESLTSALSETLMSQLSEKLEGLKPQDNKGASKGKDQDQDDSPRVKGLLKTVEELKRQNTEREQREQTTAAQLKDSKLREKLTGLLSPHGIEGSRAQHAIGYLVDAAKKVGWSDDGDSLTFKDENGDVIDAATGIKSWASSDDGKLYAAPRNANGSGEKGQQRRPVSGSGSGNAPSTADVGQGLASHFGISVT